MRFGRFEVDERAGTLTRDGTRIKLQDLPFRLLVSLLKRPGEVVTREELRAALWGSETFVDAEAGLNTAIAKIREALGDAAETPVFVETIPRRGYRFVGTVEAEVVAPAARPRISRRWLIGVVALVSVAGVWAAMALGTRSVPTSIAVVRFHNETGDPANDRVAGTLTDAVVVSLAQNPNYGVVGNSPLLVTDRIFQDVGRIGTALNVEFVILGQLQKNDSGLIARAHFIRVSDQKHLWATTIALPASGAEPIVTKAVADGVALGLSRASSSSRTSGRN